MPRHSRQRLPRHRAPRRGDDSGRRVRVNAALKAARAALATCAPGDGDAPTQPLAAVPAARRRLLLPWHGTGKSGTLGPPAAIAPAAGIAAGGPQAARSRPGAARLVRGAARSLFVTPWFAAATGFVIAAGLWVYSPHTVLRFPNSELGVSHCRSAGCLRDSVPQGGNLADASPGVKIKGARSRTRHGASADIQRNSTAAAGLKFTFTVLWHRHDGFGASVTVSGHKVPSTWRLSFDIPGAQIEYVMGVTWQANSDGSGGTASAPSWQSGGDPSDGGNGGGIGGGGGPSGPASPDSTSVVISFLITGSGPAATPAHCRFDQASCSFR